MSKILFILAVSVGSLVVGYLVRRVSVISGSESPDWTAPFSRRLKIVSIFMLNPIPIIDSFWRLPLDTKGLFLLPILGVLSLAVGGGSAFLLSRWLKIPPKRAASVFTSGMFTNILSFGGLIAFVFFGYRGYAFVQLYNMLVSVSYYMIGFPLSHRISLGPGGKLPHGASGTLRDRPYMVVPILALTAGLVLNVVHAARPLWLDSVSGILIPGIAGLLGFSIGLTLYVSRMKDYRVEIPLVMLIKFLIIPAVMIPLGAILGLPAVAGGLAFKVLIIVSVMPVAFNAVVPPAVYGFDLDLANSAWIATTTALIVVLPILYLILRP
jgi:hypothetical protein